VRLNARRGSEQCHSKKWVMAWSYLRWPLLDVRLFTTAVFDCSRSGRAKTRFGGRFFFRDFGILAAASLTAASLDARKGSAPEPHGVGV
jgi:hypothetical protein